MTQLANANLLDESVANSGSLKSRRLNNTAMTASNPNANPNPNPNPKPKPNRHAEGISRLAAVRLAM
jgi:hypothetical protein